MKEKESGMSQSNEGCIAHVMGQFITNVWKFSVEFLILLYALKQAIYEIVSLTLLYGVYLNLYIIAGSTCL
jgi:hypothetical protein